MINRNRERLIIFTRFPEPGKVKTRLIPALGAEGAAALHRRLTLRTLRVVESVRASRGMDVEVRFDGGSEAALRHWLGDGKVFRPQGEGDLGARMSRAFDESFQEGALSTIIVGTDCPQLTATRVAAALDNLSARSVVFGPATDGGYYLIGLTRPVPELFLGPAWGTETVLADSLQILKRTNVQPQLLDRLDDLDRPEDLLAWRRIVDAEETGLDRVSIVIPALNEAVQIATTIDNAQQCAPHEIIVVDGGSTDDTEQRARGAGAKVLPSPPGRARQMNAGATLATGNVLLFLHADTQLPPGCAAVASEVLRQPQVVAGAFRFRIGADFRGKCLIEWGANLRSRWLRMPYGDQALFLRRSLFEEMGGFADMPIMEDYEFVRRLRRHGHIVTARAEALTSGRRWLQIGAFRTTVINSLTIAGYHLGVPPSNLAKLYRHLPSRGIARRFSVT